jgi:hypothetical protein
MREATLAMAVATALWQHEGEKQLQGYFLVSDEILARGFGCELGPGEAKCATRLKLGLMVAEAKKWAVPVVPN